MKGRILSLILAIFWPAASLWSQGQAAIEEGRIRFCAMDIYLDSGSAPLAAYQLDFAATNGEVKIVGIEGGDHPAFKDPPFYDPKAMQHERVIIAAFSTAASADLPSGRTRVATIHLMINGTQKPQFALRLDVAADANGMKISPKASFEERKVDEPK